MTRKLTKEEFVKKCQSVHGDRYDYSDTIYIDMRHTVDVRCPKHGIFTQMASEHVRRTGCPKCANEHRNDTNRVTTDKFIKRARKVHGDKYDYSLVDYKYSREPVEIICKKCGTHFFQAPNSHLIGSGCPNCALLEQSLSLRHTTEMFIEKAKKVHGDRYSYEHTEYVKDNMPVTITCRKHGDFQQIANAHLQGCGCPRCSISRGEEKVMLCLDKLGINYETQYKINNESLFCENKRMYLDFFIPSLNVAIEYQGEQHYRPTGFVDNEERFAHQQERDNSVRCYCNEHNIKLIEIPYTEFDNIEDILTKELNTFKL